MISTVPAKPRGSDKLVESCDELSHSGRAGRSEGSTVDNQPTDLAVMHLMDGAHLDGGSPLIEYQILRL